LQTQTLAPKETDEVPHLCSFSIGFEQEEDDASSTLSACCCYCRAIATLLDIPDCSIRKEEMLHRSEMCISENGEEKLLSSGKKVFL
jgi:hypothetical protein